MLLPSAGARIAAPSGPGDHLLRRHVLRLGAAGEELADLGGKRLLKESKEWALFPTCEVRVVRSIIEMS